MVGFLLESWLDIYYGLKYLWKMRAQKKHPRIAAYEIVSEQINNPKVTDGTVVGSFVELVLVLNGKDILLDRLLNQTKDQRSEGLTLLLEVLREKKN